MNKFFDILAWIERKVFALICVTASILIIYFSNFFKHLFHNDKIDSGYFYLAMILYSSALGIIFYLSFYLPYFKNIHEEQWDSYCPNMIPTAAGLGTFAMIW
jgi:hypothetical protein